MKALKILSLVLFSSMFLLACNDDAVTPPTTTNVELNAELDANDYQDLYGPH